MDQGTKWQKEGVEKKRKKFQESTVGLWQKKKSKELFFLCFRSCNSKLFWYSYLKHGSLSSLLGLTKELFFHASKVVFASCKRAPLGRWWVQMPGSFLFPQSVTAWCAAIQVRMYVTFYCVWVLTMWHATLMNLSSPVVLFWSALLCVLTSCRGVELTIRHHCARPNTFFLSHWTHLA